MNPLEEILMTYDPRFNAPGIEDPRRRLPKHAQGVGGGGIAGPEATLGRLLPFLLGIQQQNLTGFNSQAQAGLAQPSFDSAAPIGGLNAAPGAPNGRAIHPGGAQPGGNVISPDNRTIQNANYPGKGYTPESAWDQSGRSSNPPAVVAVRGGAGKRQQRRG